MDGSFFSICYRRRARIRWLCNALKMSRLMDVKRLETMVDEKIGRLVRRRGELDEDSIAQIGENLILAKVAKRYIEKRIRPYKPKAAKGSPTRALKADFPDLGFSFEDSLGPVYKEKNFRLKTNPSILIPGFLPDGNEAFFLLRKCFLKFGSLYYLNYQTHGFFKESIFCQLFDTIYDINHRQLRSAGKKNTPFLVCTSFGCHIVISFLRWLREKGLADRLDLEGIVIISPVLTHEDVVDPTATRQKTLVGRAVSNLINVDENDPEAVRAAIKKAKSIMLKMFTSGRDLMNFESKDLIPIIAIEDDVLDVFRKEIEEDDSYFRRYLELEREPPLATEHLTDIPTLVLLAEGEMDVLVPGSPTYATLNDPEALRTIFPNGELQIVRSNSSRRKVTHSDLIFQADRFAEHLDLWLSRITK